MHAHLHQCYIEYSLEYLHQTPSALYLQLYKASEWKLPLLYFVLVTLAFLFNTSQLLFLVPYIFHSKQKHCFSFSFSFTSSSSQFFSTSNSFTLYTAASLFSSSSFCCFWDISSFNILSLTLIICRPISLPLSLSESLAMILEREITWDTLISYNNLLYSIFFVD